MLDFEQLRGSCELRSRILHFQTQKKRCNHVVPGSGKIQMGNQLDDKRIWTDCRKQKRERFSQCSNKHTRACCENLQRVFCHGFGLVVRSYGSYMADARQVAMYCKIERGAAKIQRNDRYHRIRSFKLLRCVQSAKPAWPVDHQKGSAESTATGNSRIPRSAQMCPYPVYTIFASANNISTRFRGAEFVCRHELRSKLGCI